MKEKTTNESMQETEEKRELDKELEEKEKNKRTTWVCTLKKFLKFDAEGHEPEKQAVHYRTPYSPWLLYTHTHSLWICNLEDSQKSTRQAFLNFEIFREYKALKDFGQIDYVQDRADTRSNRLGILLR